MKGNSVKNLRNQYTCSIATLISPVDKIGS